MDRAGATRTGRGGATCRVGMGDGMGPGRTLAAAVECVLRAGLAARARLTVVIFFGCLTNTGLAFLRFEPDFLE